jgi:phage-related protein
VSATADLIIRVVADTSAAKKPLDESASRVDRLGSRLNKMAIPAAAVVAGIAAFGKAAVESASRTQQAMGALDSVFGKNAAIVKKWSDSAATDVGLSKSQYGELATVIGAQFKNLGIPFDQIAGKTKTMIGLGADLAATFGGTTADAVSALSATMRGETDPIERYGVSIKQATIDAEMAKEGTDKLTGAAAKQARTMATLTLISKQTADAHGQFARESDSAAGSAQIASAQWENFKSEMGTALLPVVAQVTAALGRFASFAAKNKTTVQILVGVVGALAVAILALVAALKIYNLVMEITAVVQKTAWLSALGPIALVIAAVIAVVAVIVILWKKSETFRKIVLGTWAAIKAASSAVARVLLAVWRAVWSALSAYVRAYVTVFRTAFAVIRTVGAAIASVLKSIWRGVWSFLTGAVRTHVAIFRAVFSGIRDTVGSVAGAVRSAWNNVWDALRSGASGIAHALSAPFNTVHDAIMRVIDAVQSLIGWLGKIHVPKISLPHVPGLGSFSAPVPATAGAGLGAYAAPRVRGVAPAAALTGGGVVINVNGALDPEAVARQIQTIMGGHTRRVRGRAAA